MTPTSSRGAGRTLLARLIIQSVVWIAVLGALLFFPAGTLHWTGAWVFVGELFFAGLAIGAWLARRDPDLLRERLGPLVQKRQAAWDKVLIPAFFLLFLAWLAAMGLEVRRFGPRVPAALAAIGALGPLASYVLGYFAFRANSYAAPVVKIQSERGQRVATTGPYRYVRHPMYAGATLFLVGTPLLLGSRRGLAIAPVLVVLLGLRAVLEERTLGRELDGYAEYAARVRYRLIPWIW